MSNNYPPLGDIALDVLQRIGMGGTFAVNSFDPAVLDTLTERGLIRRHKGERVGLSDDGQRYLADLKAQGALPPRLNPFTTHRVQPNAAALEARSAVAQDAAMEEIQQLLDVIGVPRWFYGTPLLPGSRLSLLIQSLHPKSREGLKRRFEAPEFKEGA